MCFFDYVYIILSCMMSVARVNHGCGGKEGASEIKSKRKKAASAKEKEGGNYYVYVWLREKRNFCQKVVQLIIFRQSICIVSPFYRTSSSSSLNHHDC